VGQLCYRRGDFASGATGVEAFGCMWHKGGVARCACFQISPEPARLHKLLVFEIMRNAHKEVSVANEPRRPMLGILYDRLCRCALPLCLAAWVPYACAWDRQKWERRTANMNGFSVDREAGRLDFASLTKARCAHDALFCITRTGPRPEVSGSLSGCPLACGHVYRVSRWRTQTMGHGA
jgi:hypothetical protein